MGNTRALMAAMFVLLALSATVRRGGIGVGQDAAPAVQPDRCLPSHTIAFAEAPDFEASTARFHETAIYKIWSEPQVQEFAAPIKASISQLFGQVKERFAEEVGLPLDDLYSVFSGRIAIALLSVNPPDPGEPQAETGPDVVEAALFLTPRDPEKVKPVIETLRQYVLTKLHKSKIQEARCGDVSVTEITDEEKPTDPCIAYCWIGKTFVLTVGVPGKTLQEIIARWRGEQKDSLGTNENFLAARKRVGGDPIDFFLYVSATEILRTVDPYVTPEIRAPLEAAGVYGIRSVSYRLTFEGPAFRDIIHVQTDPEKRGFVDVFSPAPLDENVLSLVPAEATNCAATRFNPELLWKGIDVFAKSFGEQSYNGFREAIQAANEYLETDIEKDIIPAFGDYAVLYSRPSEMGPVFFGLLDWVAIVHLKEKTKAEAAGELLRQKTTELALQQAQRTGNVGVPFYWQSLPQGNSTIQYVTIAESPFPMLAPGYAVAGDKAVIGLSLQSIQMALNQISAPEADIRTRPDFAMVSGKVPKGAGAIIYSDVKANFPQIHAGLSMVLNMVPRMLRLGAGGGGLAIDMTKFPPPDVFMKHLFGSIAVLKGEESGIVFESYSPGNMAVGMVGVAGIAAAVAIPNLLRSRVAANEASAVGSLKTIATQEAIFKQQAEIDQDKDGVGEYGLLGETCGEIALRPGTKTIPDPVYISQVFRTGGSGGKGFAVKSGYNYRIYLPTSQTTAGDDKSLGGTREQGGAAIADPKGIDLQEKSFVVYAWPVELGSTGNRAFVINEIGEVYATRMNAKRYLGEGGPSIEAAFAKDGNGVDGWFNDRIGGIGNDGNQWAPSDKPEVEPQQRMPPADRMKHQACMSNLKQIGLGIQMYANDFDDKLPKDLQTLYPEYVASGPVFKCPEDKAPRKVKLPDRNQELEISFMYILIPEGVNVPEPAKVILCYDSAPRHNGRRNVLFVDGHVETLPEQDFQQRLAAQKWKPEEGARPE